LEQELSTSSLDFENIVDPTSQHLPGSLGLDTKSEIPEANIPTSEPETSMDASYAMPGSSKDTFDPGEPEVIRYFCLALLSSLPNKIMTLLYSTESKYHLSQV